MDIQVGDVLRLQDDQIIPVDCVLLQTPMADGSAMISTGQLDGERILKPKYAVAGTQKDLASILAKDNSRLCLNCGRPDPDLFFFKGSAQIQSGNDEQSSEEMTIAQFLPRGSILHNTGEVGVLAAAVYTGRDSKLILNQGALKYKASNTEKTLNNIYVIQACSVVALSVVLGLIGYSWME